MACQPEIHFDVTGDEQCPACKQWGWMIDEFLSPYNGRCAQCQPPTPDDPRDIGDDPLQVEYKETLRLHREELKASAEERRYWRKWSKTVLAILNDIQNQGRR